jgi:hypothetical protein
MTAKEIEVHGWKPWKRTAQEPTKLASFAFASHPNFIPNTRFKQVLVQGRDQIRVSAETEQGGCEILSLGIDSSEVTALYPSNDVESLDAGTGDPVRSIVTDSKHEHLWLQTLRGLTCLQGPYMPTPATQPCCEIVLMKEGNEDNLGEMGPGKPDQPLGYIHTISLSRTGKLFANGELLTKHCTSFATTDAYLLFTTSQHLLKFVHLRASDRE